jgi:uncharacterized protein YaeQ
MFYEHFLDKIQTPNQAKTYTKQHVVGKPDERVADSYVKSTADCPLFGFERRTVKIWNDRMLFEV